MSMFRFRLQKILELREQREKESAARLVAARDKASVARDAHAALVELREESIRGVESGGPARRAVGELRSVGLVVEELNRQVEEARGLAEASDENVQRLLAEFTNALSDRRAIDLLRDRQHEEWKADEADRDRKAMDSVAASRFALQRARVTPGGSC
jgi:flagellar FliJ protein